MKRISLFLALCLAAAIGIGGIKGVSSYKAENIPPVNNFENTPADVIKAFWDASLEGNQDKIKEVTTEQPESFSDKKPRCKSSRNTLEDSAKSDSGKNKIYPYPVLADKTDKVISYFSSDIKSENLKFVEAEEFEAYENEAVFTVKYKFRGADASIFFLLYKENTKWKIFMIDGGYGLFNPNYAKEDCSM